jgi:deoxyhypusine synthase
MSDDYYDIDKIDVNKIKTYPISERKNKAEISKMGKTIERGSTMRDFIASLPQYLKADDLISIAKHIITARKGERAVILGMGAHPIKVGLSPLIIDLIKSNIVTALSFNGAGVIHDFEIAYQGATSEDVAQGLEDGSFGMAEETGRFINTALKLRKGYGYSVGKSLDDKNLKYKDYSILWNAYKEHIPICVSVAVGNDIIHQHPDTSGDDIGYNSYEDFKLLASVLPSLDGGGVFINLGSAVIIPETFLKALNVARNIRGQIKDFYTVNFDMIQHYRPNLNVVSRPTANSGKGYSITGHHEIMFPLLCSFIKELNDE